MIKRITILVAFGMLLSLQGCAGKNANPRLVDLGDGTCQDTLTGQTWQINRSPETVASLDEAQNYIARLNKEGKHQDWRLPTVYELYDLNSLFDLYQNGNCNLSREGKYWSGEKNGEGMVGAWEIAEQCDPERRYAPAGRGYVRAVRP